MPAGKTIENNANVYKFRSGFNQFNPSNSFS